MARILLVEDDELVRKLLCDVIEAAGHTAHCVDDTAKATSLLRPNSHDLLICDMVLPTGSGREVADRALSLGMKVVLMTGHPDTAAKLTGDYVSHLTKPFGIREFIAAIDQQLHS